MRVGDSEACLSPHAFSWIPRIYSRARVISYHAGLIVGTKQLQVGGAIYAGDFVELFDQEFGGFLSADIIYSFPTSDVATWTKPTKVPMVYINKGKNNDGLI